MSKRQAVIEEWIEEHPYLDEIAKLQRLLLTVLEEHFSEKLPLAGMLKSPEEIKKKYLEKLPVLEVSLLTDKFYQRNADVLKDLVAAFSRADLPEIFKEQSKALNEFLETKSDTAIGLIKGILGEQNDTMKELAEKEIDLGIANYFCWNLLVETLEPLRLQLEALQAENDWKQPHCPLCGQLPGIAQLIRTEKGRERELSCALCQTKWRYKRIGCPHCGNEEQESLHLIELTEVPAFRLDTCNQCKGYLKTYLDEGNEEIALKDWATLHLDIIARDAGFKRKDYQLYKI